MKSIERKIVAAILLSKDENILLGKVKEGGVYPDCWHIPGGGVEEGETLEEALKRETMEETGIDISDENKKLISDSDSGNYTKTDSVTGEKTNIIMHFNVYQVKLRSSSYNINIFLNDDLKSYKWVKIKNLFKYKHTPPSIKLFKKLGWLK